LISFENNHLKNNINYESFIVGLVKVFISFLFQEFVLIYGVSNNDCPLSKAQTVRDREKSISFSKSTLKNTVKKVIWMISI
jgi:hypothetical protein